MKALYGKNVVKRRGSEHRVSSLIRIIRKRPPDTCSNSQAWQAGRTVGERRDRQQPASMGINSVSQASRQDRRHAVSSTANSHQGRGQSQNTRTLNAQQTHGGGQYDTSQRGTPQSSRIQQSGESSARQQYSTRINGPARQFEPSTSASRSSESRSSPRTNGRRPSGSSDKRGTSSSYSMQRYLAETQRSQGGDEPWKMVNSFRYPSDQADHNARSGRSHRACQWH